MTPRAVLASFLHDQMATRGHVVLMSAALTARAAGQGARVLVIRNTVQAARGCLTTLNDAPCLCVDGVRTLRHARFAVEDRARLDAAVEAALGKASRAGGLVVCGAQTLEQSLDIDEDFLIIDFAPVDVLLQRFGRLHRHDRARPDGFEQPHAVIALPENGLEPLIKPIFFNGLRVGARGVSMWTWPGWRPRGV